MNQYLKRTFLTLTVACCTCLSGTGYGHAHPSIPADSVGIEKKDGRRYVLHRVDQGQTLYGVARRYGASLEAIRTANPDLTEAGGVRYDQLLRVPVGEAAPAVTTTVAVPVAPSRKEQREAERLARKAEKAREKAEREGATAPLVAAAPTTAKANVPGNGLHLVETGQTLYSLAVRYNVTMADLRRWNNLGADGIQVGQTLAVTETAATDPRPAERPAVAKTKTPPVKSTPTEPVRIDTKPIVVPDPVATPGSKPKPRPAEPKPTERTTEPRPDKPAPAAPNKRVQGQIGFADVIDGADNSRKYLALHRSAPVGTLVQVRNDITNQSLYVKVIGKLPDTGLNDQVLIRLSGRAFEKLSPNGQRFRAEVSYAN